LPHFDSASEFALQRSTLAQPPVHIGFEEAHHAALFLLGRVERGFRVGDQDCRIRAVGRENGDADAHAHLDAAAVYLDLVSKRQEYPIRDFDSAFRLFGIADNQVEFVAAHAREKGHAHR